MIRGHAPEGVRGQRARDREITPDVSGGAGGSAPVLPTHTERLASVDAVTTRAATVSLACRVADMHCGHGYPGAEVPAAYHELVERTVEAAIEGLLPSLAVPTLEAWRGRGE